ncbi:MAG TPA: tetratricopeptide repeat protein, partial [Cyclobacteriaceae bacterium]
LGIRDYKPAVTNDHYREASNQRQQRRQEYQKQSSSTIKPSGTKISLPIIIGFAIFMITLITVVFTIAFSDDDDFDSMNNYQQGDAYYHAGNYDSATLLFRQSLAINPDNADALIGYGNTKLALEQYDSALLLYDKVLATTPDYEEALFQKGRVFYFQKNYDQSIALLKDLVTNDPAHNEATQLLGDSFYNKQQYDSALVWYDKAYATGFRNTYLCYLMGYIYETKGKNDKAIQLYKETLEYDDTIADVYSRLGALIPGSDGEVYRTKAAELETKNK